MLPLYDYQKEVVAEMLSGKVLNTSDIGTGKTLMALGCVEKLNSTINLVVAPKSLLLQWKGEVDKFMPELSVFVMSGTKARRTKLYEEFKKSSDKRVAIITYETLRVDIPLIFDTIFDCVIFDEAHKLKEPTTKLKKQLKFLRAKHRFGLTGSPVVNHYGNVYNVLNSLKPDDFPNYYAFVAKYGVKAQWGGVLYFRNQDQIRQMFAPHIVHKGISEVGKSMPELLEIEVPVELNSRERRIYKAMQMELVFDFDEADIAKLSSPMMLQNTLTKIGKLQEVCDHLSLVGDHKDSSKLATLKEILEDQVRPDEKVIIFTRFSRMAKLLADELDAGLITGAVKDREQVLSHFRHFGRILVGTNAMREGLNIQQANVVVMYDQDYTSAGMKQRIGRAYRLGQKKRVRVYHLLADKTIDYRIRNILSKKESLAEDLLATIKELLQ